MKSIKLLMASAMLAIGSTAAMAQASYTDKDGNEYQFKRHWFLDIQAGGQYTVGEASFSDLLSPNFQGAIGYQFSPVFGLRGQINGIWSKGGWNGYKATKDGTPYTASYKWKYVAPGVDFMSRISAEEAPPMGDTETTGTTWKDVRTDRRYGADRSRIPERAAGTADAPTLRRTPLHFPRPPARRALMSQPRRHRPPALPCPHRHRRMTRPAIRAGMSRSQNRRYR